MSWPYAQATSGEQAASDAVTQAWLQAARGKQAIAVGPGLPVEPAVQRALHALIDEGTAPMVLDADALNQLVGHEAVLLRARERGRDLVLTPHPGEAARLLGTSVRAVQADRYESARRLSQRTGAIVVLKGARTVVFSPESAARGTGGEAPSPPLSLCPTGNAGMGTGGMGDVLTGILGALLASGWPAYEAACAAVYLHGLAGDCAAQRRAEGSLLCASELVEALDAARAQALAECRQPRAVSWPTTRL
jgi:NAD(P)H-hydrate epimerase